METGLIRYDAMVHAIAECHEVDEVKDIRDKALALEKYAQQAMNTDAERQALDIRLRAERKAGKLLAGMNKYKGRPPKKRVASDDRLSDLGISKDQSSKWQKLASISNKDFEKALADPDIKPSTNGLIRKVNGSSDQMDADALWVWGRLREMERRDLFTRNTGDIVGEFTQAMLDDMYRLIPLAMEWLKELEASCYD